MAKADRTTTESWKDIPEYTGYQASNQGRIRSFWKQDRISNRFIRSFLSAESKILKPRMTKSGYLKINLRHDSGKIRTPRVHRLVLFAFVGPPPAGMVTCHKHAPRTNNAIENLRWSTPKSNQQDAGHKGTRTVLSREQLDELVALARNGVIAAELAIRFGIGRPSVSRALAREGFQYKRSYRPPSILSPDDLHLAIRLAREGITHREIGKRIGASRPTITRWLARSSRNLA